MIALTKDSPMAKPGRPKGTVKHTEEMTEALKLRLSPTCKAWVKAGPKGWLPDLLEAWAASYDAGELPPAAIAVAATHGSDPQ